MGLKCEVETPNLPEEEETSRSHGQDWPAEHGEGETRGPFAWRAGAATCRERDGAGNLESFVGATFESDR